MTLKKNIVGCVLITSIFISPLHSFKDSEITTWGRDAFFAIGAFGGCMYLLDRATGFYFRTIGCDQKNGSLFSNRRSRISKHQALIADLEKKIKELRDELSGWEKQVDNVIPMVEQFSTQITQLRQQFKTFTIHEQKGPQEAATRSALLEYEGQLTEVLKSIDSIKKQVDLNFDQKRTDRSFVEQKVLDLKKRQDELAGIITSLQSEVTHLKQLVQVLDAEVFETVTPDHAKKEGDNTQPKP
ncbi:MAG TPA: hypothetical protein VJ201_02225 [Candidatus Babeliales bacterium]|nr:hypothetical protein [Candidatus Babeliales bacterium]